MKDFLRPQEIRLIMMKNQKVQKMKFLKIRKILINQIHLLIDIWIAGKIWVKTNMLENLREITADHILLQ